jgi:hypothetical protein
LRYKKAEWVRILVKREKGTGRLENGGWDLGFRG